MRDPYLVPGQVCRIIKIYYYNGNPLKVENTVEFVKYENDYPVFRYPGWAGFAELYRPIGTEWDRALPEHTCSTVDSDGKTKLWIGIPKTVLSKQGKNRFFDHGIWAWAPGCHSLLVCGICPEKTRYEGDNWKTSLRMRPEWAKVD